MTKKYYFAKIYTELSRSKYTKYYWEVLKRFISGIYAKKPPKLNWMVFDERETGLKPATLSLEG